MAVQSLSSSIVRTNPFDAVIADAARRWVSVVEAHGSAAEIHAACEALLVAVREARGVAP
jgi:hypothetical protein